MEICLRSLLSDHERNDPAHGVGTGVAIRDLPEVRARGHDYEDRIREPARRSVRRSPQGSKGEVAERDALSHAGGETVNAQPDATPALAGAAGSALPPTHKCRVCGALWRVNLQRDTAEDEYWNLCSESCHPCCDNAAIGEQLVPMTVDDLEAWLRPNSV